MRILLIGGSGSLINRLIVRLKKEGHRVFLLTGSRFRDDKYERVFERYDFPYSAEQIAEVFESVDPDAAVFTGAYDPNYDWRRQENRTGVYYLSDLTNLLMSFSMRRRGRFIYLSSENVYDAKLHHSGRVSEETAPDSADYRGMALSQAEALCESYRRDRKSDIVTLRIGGLYKIPEKVSDIDEPVTQMCLDAFQGKNISCNKANTLSPFGEPDAVQFIMQVIFADTCKYGLYNIAADRMIGEEELARMVSDREILQSSSLQERAVLNNKRFKDEFGMNRFSSLEADIRKIKKEMEAHPEVFLLDKKRRKTFVQSFLEKSGWIVRALVPLLENIILFVPFFILSGLSSGSRFFSRIDFFLLYVLLFAVVHGQQQAIVSALLSTLGYLYRQMGERSGLDVLVDYNTYVWIAQLFIVGLIVGYMRDQIDKLTGEAEDDHAYMSQQVTDIRDINESNIRVKDALETQVISQHDSVGKVYEIVSRLDRYSGDEVLFYAAGVVQELMHTKDVAIYANTNGPYTRLFTATTKKARSLGNSVRYRELEDLYEALKDHKVFINRSLKENLPIMACATYVQSDDGEDHIGIIVMVWGLSWERTTLSEANLLAVICALIQNAASRAGRYLNMIEEERYIEGTAVLHTEAFEQLIRSHSEAQKNGLTQVVFAHIDREGRSLRELSDLLKGAIRVTDYPGILSDGELYLLFTNTDEVGAEVALKRIRGRGIKAETVPLPDLEEETQEKHSLAGGIRAEIHS